MKITKIDITQYQQFKNFVLDLTYPEGHAKVGQPLDKVCFIGQSGTGKTTLLNLIADCISKTDYHDYNVHYPENAIFSVHSDYSYLSKIQKETEGQIWKLYKDNRYETPRFFNPIKFLFDDGESIQTITPRNFLNQNDKTQKELLYITADILANYQYFTKSKKEKELIGIANPKKFELSKEVQAIKYQKSIKIDNNTDANIWKYIFKEIDVYDEKVDTQNKELSKKIYSVEKIKTFEEFMAWQKEFIEWKAAQKNPREELANKLAEILSLFQLEIDAEDTKNYLTVKAKNESGIIPSEGISTGTKSLILTTALLWGIGLDNTVVLFDEPERSLYPNVQRKLVDFYTEISPSSQYFFATHSPVIAASFEPWEIVELVFDENGYVFQELYYEGERNVDNYFTDFRYLRWDDILMKGFGLMEEGNSDFRTKELMQAARYRKQLEKMEQDGLLQSPDYQLILEKYIKSAKRIGWNYEKNK